MSGCEPRHHAAFAAAHGSRGLKPEAGFAGVTPTGAIFSDGLNLLKEVLTARIPDIEAYGSYGLALTMVKVCEIIAVFGSPRTVLRFLPVRICRSEMHLALGEILVRTLTPLAFGGAFPLAGHDQIAKNFLISRKWLTECRPLQFPSWRRPISSRTFCRSPGLRPRQFGALASRWASARGAFSVLVCG